MTTEAEGRYEQAKRALEFTEARIIGAARAIVFDHRHGYTPTPEVLRHLGALTDAQQAAQQELHDAGAELLAALEPTRKATA